MSSQTIFARSMLPVCDGWKPSTGSIKSVALPPAEGNDGRGRARRLFFYITVQLEPRLPAARPAAATPAAAAASWRLPEPSATRSESWETPAPSAAL
jgi:hypothetical protein